VKIPHGTANGLTNQNGFIAAPPETPPTMFTSTPHPPFVATLSGSSLTWTIGRHSVTAFPSSTSLSATPLPDGTYEASLPDHTTVNLNLAAAPSASITLTEALANKIQPITASYTNISDGLPGSPSAEPDGSASYRLPLWTPDGVNGMKPSLAIAYNSEVGTGLLGPRWQLTGLSAITRCKKTRAQDGTVTPIQFTGDTLCLDGQRLIHLSPTSTEFHPENDTFIKVVATAIVTGEYSTLTAYHKDGRIFYYGRTPSSRLHGNVNGGLGDDITYAWYLDKIMDRYGNSILITYANAISSPSTSLTNQVQELEPSTITWGGTDENVGQRSVSFGYESLPSGMTVDTQHMRWVAGLGIGAAQYLKTISIYAPDGSGAAPLLKTYGFTYNNTATAGGAAIVTGDRVLSTISECDANGYCKKPTTIQWEAGSNSFTKVDMGLTDPVLWNYVVYGRTYDEQFRRVLVADLDDDGRDDIIYRGFVPPHAAGSQQCLGWIARPTSVSNGTPSFGAPYNLPLHVDPDWSCSGVATDTGGQTGTTGSQEAIATDPIFQDIDGDGYVDIVMPYSAYFRDDSLGFDPNASSNLIGGYHLYLNTSMSDSHSVSVELVHEPDDAPA
jgi:hypothetical protein